MKSLETWTSGGVGLNMKNINTLCPLYYLSLPTLQASLKPGTQRPSSLSPSEKEKKTMGGVELKSIPFHKRRRPHRCVVTL